MKARYLDILREVEREHEQGTGSSKDSHLMIIDGLNTFIRVFSAVPALNDDGDHIGGVTGFLRSIAANIRQLKPTRCVIVFDGKGGSRRRKDIYPEYKANRANKTAFNRYQEFASLEDAEVILISAKIESEINELDSPEEKKIFLEDIGMQEPGSSKLIRSTYKLLNLHTFFTAGKKEVRAWTVGIGQNAYDAAGQIHSDFQKGFICSEVISYNDYIDNGSEIKSKEAGKMRLEGKDYIVEDGDIMHFRFNI